MEYSVGSENVYLSKVDKKISTKNQIMKKKPEYSVEYLEYSGGVFSGVIRVFRVFRRSIHE